MLDSSYLVSRTLGSRKREKCKRLLFAYIIGGHLGFEGVWFQNSKGTQRNMLESCFLFCFWTKIINKRKNVWSLIFQKTFLLIWQKNAFLAQNIALVKKTNCFQEKITFRLIFLDIKTDILWKFPSNPSRNGVFCYFEDDNVLKMQKKNEFL